MSPNSKKHLHPPSLIFASKVRYLWWSTRVPTVVGLDYFRSYESNGLAYCGKGNDGPRQEKEKKIKTIK